MNMIMTLLIRKEAGKKMRLELKGELPKVENAAEIANILWYLEHVINDDGRIRAHISLEE